MTCGCNSVQNGGKRNRRKRRGGNFGAPDALLGERSYQMQPPSMPPLSMSSYEMPREEGLFGKVGKTFKSFFGQDSQGGGGSRKGGRRRGGKSRGGRKSRGGKKERGGKRTRKQRKH